MHGEAQGVDFSDREEGGGSPSGMMIMTTVRITEFIGHLFSRQSSKHFTCFNLLCPLKKSTLQDGVYCFLITSTLNIRLMRWREVNRLPKAMQLVNGDAQEPGAPSSLVQRAQCAGTHEIGKLRAWRGPFP